MFLSRPRHYGVTAVVGASVVVSGIVADELAAPVYFTIRHVSLGLWVFTGYFTHTRPIFWIGNLTCFAVAAGLTALRVARVRATEGTPPGAGVPRPGPWAPGPAGGPWNPPPQAPYSSPPQAPYGPSPQAPYGPSPQAPYGPPPQAPYGSSPQAPYGPPPQGPPPQGPPPQGPYGPPPQPPSAPPES